MNLLEFPNEILFEFCKYMDFQSRVSFRKVCKQTHYLVNNPKKFVSKEKIEEWFEKTKMMVGMTLLDNIRNCSILKSPSGKNGYFRLGIDDNYEFFITVGYRAIPFFRNFEMSNRHYKIESDDSITINESLYSKYKLDHHRNIFDYKEAIGKFLYDIYITFVSFDQNKNKEKISNTHLSNLIRIILNRPSKFHNDTSLIFRCSSYFIFGDQSENFFKTNIETIVNDFQKDLSRYFMDGEEAEQFLNFGQKESEITQTLYL